MNDIDHTSAGHRYTITEPTRIPALSIVLGFGPMLPIVAGGVLTWLLAPGPGGLVLRLTLVWAATILAFLSGVRRGLSFRSPDGETVPQLVTMLWLFCLAFAALALGPGVPAVLALIVGYASVAVFDPLAARREEAPPYFARLRPFQMPIGLVGLLAILAHLLVA